MKSNAQQHISLPSCIFPWVFLIKVVVYWEAFLGRKGLFRKIQISEKELSAL